MKQLLSAALIFFVVLASSCKKDSDDSVTPVNCDGVVTDTLPTGNTARVYMPNAFTPNNDGLNDIIRPVLYNVQSVSFTIYDQDNNTVFTTNQLNTGWVTTVTANTSVKYNYKIQATTNDGRQIGMCGDVYKLSCIKSGTPNLYFEDQVTQNGFTGTTFETLQPCP